MVEVAAAVDVVRDASDPPLALFHCVSSYPAAAADANLRAIETMRRAFGVPVGWSDHTPGVETAIAAVALGATLVEKHLTLDRARSGPDHQASLDPTSFASLVQAIRETEASLGDGDKRPVAAETEIAAVARRSLHWRVDLAAGSVIDAGALVALRPGTGLVPASAAGLVGRRTAVDVRAGRMIRTHRRAGRVMSATTGPPRVITVLSTGRQDWGILRPVVAALRTEPGVVVDLVVGGMHLSPRHGHTVDLVRADGFEPDAELDWIGAGDDPPADLQAAAALMAVAGHLRAARSDALVIVGDRFESAAAALAATLERVPIAHLHGGEQTLGAFDDALRHAITKLSHLHLVSRDEHAARVIALGEDPATVHVIGAPGTDARRSHGPARSRRARRRPGAGPRRARSWS